MLMTSEITLIHLLTSLNHVTTTMGESSQRTGVTPILKSPALSGKGYRVNKQNVCEQSKNSPTWTKEESLVFWMMDGCGENIVRKKFLTLSTQDALISMIKDARPQSKFKDLMKTLLHIKQLTGESTLANQFRP